jgi:hypothetical protein
MADLALEPLVAAEHPATRAALGRARAIRSTALGAGALALVAGAWLLWLGGSGSRALEAHGERVAATVTAVAPQRVNGGGNERGRVTFTFTFEGEQRTATNSVGGTILQYSVGQAVDVLVPPDDPAGARMTGELDRPGWEVPGVLFLGFALTALTWGSVRARALHRMAGCLGAEPWLAVRSRLDHTAIDGLGGPRAMGVVVLARVPGDSSIVVTNRGLRRFGVDVEPLAWVVGWGTDELVLSPPGGGRPLEVRPVVARAPERATGGTRR